MIDDKGAGEWPYKAGQRLSPRDVFPLSIREASLVNCGYAAGRKAEREYNWKAVAKICGVNPYTHRPCIEKVEEKFWCPICVCAGKIRGGQDEK